MTFYAEKSAGKYHSKMYYIPDKYVRGKKVLNNISNENSLLSLFFLGKIKSFLVTWGFQNHYSNTLTGACSFFTGG